MGGAALTLDVLSATDEHGQACQLHSPSSAHVTVICLRTGKARIKAETTRFVQDVTPYLPEMITDSMLQHTGAPNPAAFLDATYNPNLFNRGIKAYLPSQPYRDALAGLNEKLARFVHGTYVPTTPGAPGALGTYDLIVEATTKPNRGSYTPHLTVKAPSTYGGTDNPVQTVSATLKQTLTIRYYSYK